MGFLSSLFGGPSPQEEAAQASMAQAGKDMIYDSNISFQDAQAMFKSINGQLAPILAEGPSQFGMSTAQEAAERTMLTTQLSQAGQQESQAVNESLASRNVTPGSGISAGALAEIEGALAQKTANAEAMGQLGITDEGYNIGRTNFWNAASEEGQVGNTEAGLTTGTGSIGVNATSNAFNEANTINSQQNGLMKGLLAVGGDIAGSFIGDPMAGNQFVSGMSGSAPPGGGGMLPIPSMPGFGSGGSGQASANAMANANANSSSTEVPTSSFGSDDISL